MLDIDNDPEEDNIWFVHADYIFEHEMELN